MLAHIGRLVLAFLFIFTNVLAALLVYGVIGSHAASGAAAQSLPQTQDTGIKFVYEDEQTQYPLFTNLTEYPHLQKIQ